MLDQKTLKNELTYDEVTGIFTRNSSSSNKKINNKVGCDDGKGYLRISVRGCLYFSHRLAFLYMTGKFPVGMVDHINGNRSDNSWANLRTSNRSENYRNTGKRKSNTSGFKGVSKQGNRYGLNAGQMANKTT